MRTIYHFLVVIVFSFLVSVDNFCYSQYTLLVDPDGAGGFELGSSFADNGWTVSNGANNPWILGPHAIGNCAYVTSNGLTPGYSITAPASNFFWRDIVVPSGQERVNVSFIWLSGGKSATAFNDCWQVFFVPSTTTPVGATTYPGSGLSLVPSSLPGGIFVGGGNLQSNWFQTFNSSTYLSAGSYRIVFHWKNDGAGGIPPGASIDNISIVAFSPTSFYSARSGNWSDQATWGGLVPSGADSVIVNAGHTVTIDAVGQAAGNVSVAGILTFGTTPTEFQANDLTVQTGGLVNVFSGTIAKTLRVRGNLINDGRVNTLASTTVNGTLNLNGAAPQTVSGTGVWGGTVSSTTSTNQVGVIGILLITNASTSVPGVNYTMGGTLRVRSTFTVNCAVNLNGSIWIAGNYAAQGSLTFSNNGGFINGVYGRWYTTSQTNWLFSAGQDPSTGNGSSSSILFPMLNSTGVPRYCWITRSSSTITGNTAGEIRVTYTNEGTPFTGNAFTDGAYNVSNYWPGTWNVTTANGYVYTSGTHILATMAPGLYLPNTGNSRLLVNGGTFVGTHQLGTGTPGAQRTGLSTAQLTSTNGFVMGISSSELCAPSVANINENFDAYGTGNMVPFCWNRIVVGSATQTISSTSPASGTSNISQYSSLGSASYVVLPQMTDMLNVSSGNYRLKFKARTASTFGQLAVGYIPSSSLVATNFVLISNVALTNSNYGSETVVNIPAGIPAGSRLVIANLGVSTSTHYWDDVIYEYFVCNPPTTFTVNSTYNSARITWNSSPSSNTYELFVQQRGIGFFPTSGTLVYSNYFIATNLLPGVEYEYYLRTNCSSFYSQWQGPYFFKTQGLSISTENSCVGDTVSLTIRHAGLINVANASLRLLFNSDSLDYLGFTSLNPAFNGIALNVNNGVVSVVWNSPSNQTIAAGDMVNLRFRVNGNSNITWDTLIIPSEFYDSAYNLVPQTFSSGSINHRTTRLVWNRNICQAQSFTLGNQSYTSSGTYQGRRFGTGGACDTLVTLNLNVLPRQTNPSVTVCSNQPYPFNGLQLNTSGVYLDTLVNMLGCDSIVQLNLTVNTAYNQNLTMTICAGGSLQFGNQNLMVAGNYTNTFVSSRGCDSLVNLSLTVSNSTTIISSNGQNGFCPNGSVRIGLANPQPNATYTWQKDGAIIPNATSDTLSVNQTGNYQLAVQVSPTCIIQSNTLTIGILNCNRISGDLRYDNNNQTPLAGIPVHLKSLLGNIVASDTTDSSGYYDMAGYANGNYLLDAAINYTWGGVNSTDALQVTRYFTSLVSLSPLRIKVGDVNGNMITNSGDALLINRRITGLITSFSVGNFVNNLPSLNALGNPLVANLRALSTGDVNGTHNPQPFAPILVLDTVYGNGNIGTAVVRFTTSGSGVFERGVVWSSSPNPTILSSKSVSGSGGFGFIHSFSSIDPNNLQYARAYAKTSVGVYYSNERSFIPIPGLRCPGTPSVTDIDGNLYHTVQIGNQCWTQSNLKTSKYRNGDNITTGLNNSQWSSTNFGAYSIYNNNWLNDVSFGKLYNNYAATDSRGLCPLGWHVPSDREWNILVKYLDPSADTVCSGCSQSSTAVSALKSITTQPTPGGWNPPNAGVTNSSGFTALPGGLRYDWGDFSNIHDAGLWHSSSVTSNSGGVNHVWVHSISNSSIYRWQDAFTRGFSVRCLKHAIPQVNTSLVTNVSHSTALVNGEVISGGDQNIIRGFCYSITSNPTILNDTIINGTGLGVYLGTLLNLIPSTTYYVRAYATNSLGTSYGNVASFTTDSNPGLRCIGTPTVTDIDGNVYNTVQIGTQCWTQSNLKTSRYRNGDSIPTGLSNSAWQSITSGAYAIYNNDPVNNGLYGKLYNHYAVTDSRGLCPIGWHVPSDGEWTTLENLLGGGSVAGGALKSTATQPISLGWNSPNTGATNSSGFTALPGGIRDITGGFYSTPTQGYWWSSSLSFGSNAFYRFLYYDNSVIYSSDSSPTRGFSVRCVRD